MFGAVPDVLRGPDPPRHIRGYPQDRTDTHREYNGTQLRDVTEQL